MPLIVEDGTLVADANSYSTLVQIRQYATDRGITLSGDDNVVIGQAVRAMDYIESFASEFKGAPVDLLVQALSWPRVDVTIEDIVLASDYIPPQLRYAQGAAVLEIHAGNDLLPFNSGAQIRAERLGSLAVEYFSQRGLDVSVPLINNLLAPLLTTGAVLVTRRI